MKTYKIFKESVKTITRYYMLLVEETKSSRLVGSTNEWVLDNYYQVSEQEKVMRGELKSIGSGRWAVGDGRVEVLWKLLEGYLRRNHFAIDKGLLFRYLRQVQQSQKDYLSYPEVYALLPLLKALLIRELASLCQELEAQGAYHYSPTDKENVSPDRLSAAARQNLMMMNIFNSLKKVVRLPMAELVDAVSYSEKMLRGEKAAMYDQMQDKTKEDYRAMVVRTCRKRGLKEYDFVKSLTESGEHVGWALFPPKRWGARAHGYVWIVVLATLALAGLVVWVVNGQRAADQVLPTIILFLLLVVPMSQVVIDLFNWLLSKLHKPVGTFKLRFKDGVIPEEYATMVIMPTILKNKEKVEELMGVLEMYYLSNINRGEGKIVGSGEWIAVGGKCPPLPLTIYIIRLSATPLPMRPRMRRGTTRWWRRVCGW